MRARHLVTEARKRAGLTQAQLAVRLGTHQPVIARWESGRSEPKFSTVVAAVRAAGFDLGLHITLADDHDLALIRRELTLLPHERLSRMVEAVRAFRAMEIASHG